MLVTLKNPQCKINLLVTEIYENRPLDGFLFLSPRSGISLLLLLLSFFFNAEHSLSNSENPRPLLVVLVFKHWVGGEGPWEVSLGLKGACRHGCGTKGFSLLLD